MGPFEVQRGLDGATQRIVHSPSGSVVATILVKKESEGLAVGVAALPGLLESCRFMLEVLDHANSDGHWVGEFADKCRAAIAKAEGK